MSSVPPGLSPLRLPRGESVFIPPVAPWGTRFRIFSPSHRPQAPYSGGFALGCGNWGHYLFIVAPTATSSSDLSSSDSFSDQSGYVSSHNEPDSDNVDPDFPEDGYWHR